MLTRYSPFERFTNIDRFGKMMDELWNESGSRSGWFPSVDVIETDNELKFVADLPGMSEKDVTVEVQDDRLTLRGDRKFTKDEKKDDYVMCERSYGSFQRQFRLDTPVKPKEIKATFEKGVLTVKVPKQPTTEPTKIAIAAR
ncbi:MAG TPA: Hsp20/alpha crystallin family protein [Fimbriimonadaceae bacterium]|nr:Hsp20/alpha crystallin family protein [Fimbriimonadaceae bacterium]